MKPSRFSATAILIAAIAGAASIEMLAPPQVHAQGGSLREPSKAKKKPPLILEERGIFWAGGDYLTRTQPGAAGFKVLVGQAYVEYAIPHIKRRNAPPIVLYPGGNLNGTHFLTTPDGREGWADFFLRRGYSVYIVDPPGRGRAGWSVDQFNLVRAGLASPSSQPSLAQWDTDAWREWNQGPEFGVHGAHDPSCIGNDGRGVPPFTCHGDRFPNDPASLRHFLAAHVPVGPTAGGETSALVALLQRIGPAIYIGHSAGGSFGGGVANSRPELFEAMIGIEPAQACNIATNAVVAGIVRVPTMSLHGINQAGRPNVPDCRAKYAEINAAGGKADFIDLIADHGIWGNGHIMMWEDNSDEIAQIILDWIEENVE